MTKHHKAVWAASLVVAGLSIPVSGQQSPGSKGSTGGGGVTTGSSTTGSTTRGQDPTGGATAGAGVPSTAPTRGEDGARAGQHAGPHEGHDRKMAITHALCMAIEGSSLWGCAQKQGVAAATTRAGDAGVGEAGQGASDPAAQLAVHAQKAFNASRQLFTAAQNDGQRGGVGGEGQKDEACARYHQAAFAYAQALASMAGQDQQGEGREPGGGGAEAAASTTASQDAAKIALINHSVKEAVEGVHMRVMIDRQGGGQPSESLRALRAHAEQMVTSGRQTISMIDGSAQAGRTTGQRDSSVVPTGRKTQDAADDTERPAARATTTPRAGGQEDAAGQGVVGAGVQGAGSAQRLAQLGNQVIQAALMLEPSQGDAGVGGRQPGQGGQPGQSRRSDR